LHLLFQGEDGTGGAGLGGSGFEFGVDPNEDPELALVSVFCEISFYFYGRKTFSRLYSVVGLTRKYGRTKTTSARRITAWSVVIGCSGYIIASH
jgi:hypothetical protein